MSTQSAEPKDFAVALGWCIDGSKTEVAELKRLNAVALEAMKSVESYVGIALDDAIKELEAGK